MYQKIKKDERTCNKPHKIKLVERNCIKASGKTFYYLYSFRKRKIISPAHVEYSKRGTYIYNTYFLFPGKYGMNVVDISNSGAHYCHLAVLLVREDGSTEELKWGGAIPLPLQETFCECQKIRCNY